MVQFPGNLWHQAPRRLARNLQLADALLLFSRGLGGLGIDHGLLVHIVINCRGLEVQHFLDEFQRGVTVGWAW